MSKYEKIAEINTKIENNISPEFMQIFEGQKYLIISKTSELFKCFLKLIFNDIKEEIEEYVIENINKEEEDIKKKEEKLKKLKEENKKKKIYRYKCKF